MIRSILLTILIKVDFSNSSLVYSFINKSTRHWKINNMHFMSLTKVSVLMQVLNSTRKHYTKNEYFPKHILFTTIYLL
jgi:hypothetical protein